MTGRPDRTDGPVCATCGQPVTPRGYTSLTGGAWRHRDPTHEPPCRKQRAEADRLRRERVTGARYLSGYPGPIVPTRPGA